MTIYYYEGSPIAAPVVFESNEPIFVADASNLSQHRVSQGSQRWELSFELQNSELDQDYFVAVVTGASSVRTMTMPQLLAVDKKVTCTETPTVAEVTREGSSTVRCTFGTAGKLLPKGTFIQFSNHSKLYVLTEDVTTIAGNRTLNIFPRLYNKVLTSTNVRHAGSGNKPQLNFYPSTDNLNGIRYEDGVMYSPGTIKLIEVI